MPNIPYPDIPPYPGVPALVRAANVPAVIQVALGEIQTTLASAMQSQVQWGIFDSQGNQLGLVSQSNGLFKSIIQSITSNAPVLSTNSVEYTQDTKISDFPVETGGFASYNKVVLPALPRVTLVLGGSQADRSNFLNQIDAACLSINQYFVITPETVYGPVSMERYNFVRRSERGATLLALEISLKEIRQVTASFSTVQTPISSPQNPAATPQTNSGLVQPQAPPQSVLKSLYNLWPALQGAN